MPRLARNEEERCKALVKTPEGSYWPCRFIEHTDKDPHMPLGILHWFGSAEPLSKWCGSDTCPGGPQHRGKQRPKRPQGGGGHG